MLMLMTLMLMVLLTFNPTLMINNYADTLADAIALSLILDHLRNRWGQPRYIDLMAGCKYCLKSLLERNAKILGKIKRMVQNEKEI